jgi:hypothetical protein
LITTSLDKNSITAWKSITKLVIFQSFVAKCCNIRIIWLYYISEVCRFSAFWLRGGNWQPNTLWGCQCPVCNRKWLKNSKLCKVILSAFYNISQRNFGILLILWCSFKLWWNFYLDLFSLLCKMVISDMHGDDGVNIKLQKQSTCTHAGQSELFLKCC